MSNYDDIIHMKRPVSRREKMSIENRAAQFAPFAALTGHDEAVEETARLTDVKRELDECLKQELNRKLIYISEHPGEDRVKFTYFLPDEKKSGGEYVTVCETVKKVDEYEHTVIFMDKTVVCIENIFAIDGELFNCLE